MNPKWEVNGFGGQSKLLALDFEKSFDALPTYHTIERILLQDGAGSGASVNDVVLVFRWDDGPSQAIGFMRELTFNSHPRWLLAHRCGACLARASAAEPRETCFACGAPQDWSEADIAVTQVDVSRPWEEIVPGLSHWLMEAGEKFAYWAPLEGTLAAESLALWLLQLLSRVDDELERVLI